MPEHSRKTRKEALNWVRKHGIVLQSARGPVPNFAEWVAGEKIRGSWWGHPRAQEIFLLADAICDSGKILTCKLVHDKVTYVHRRIWPALVRLAGHFSRKQLAKVESVHTNSGKHVLRITPFPKWAPLEIRNEAKKLTELKALKFLGKNLVEEISHQKKPASKRNIVGKKQN